MTPLEVTVGVPPVGTPKVNITYEPTGTVQGEGTRSNPYLVDDSFPAVFSASATSGLFNYDVYVYAFYYDTNDYAYDSALDAYDQEMTKQQKTERGTRQRMPLSVFSSPIS